MIFEALRLSGAYIVTPERFEDERGFFARTWCQREFQERGLNPRLVQCSISFNQKRGTWRGMHYQAEPYEEAKLVRCTRGAIWDVIADVRADSETFMEYALIMLSAENRHMVYVPEGIAHGFITLEDNTEVFYQMSEMFAGESARGFRWNDPSFGIELPLEAGIISERDRNYPDFHLMA